MKVKVEAQKWILKWKPKNEIGNGSKLWLKQKKWMFRVAAKSESWNGSKKVNVKVEAKTWKLK